MLSAIEKHSFFTNASAIYLLISFLLYHYSNTEDIRDKNRQITSLKQEISKLQSMTESDKHIVELLEKELEKAYNNSEQEHH